jgi:hypothetical protein
MRMRMNGDTGAEPRLGNGGGEAGIRVNQTESDRIKPMQGCQGNVPVELNPDGCI